jgi:hypothetical protein
MEGWVFLPPTAVGLPDIEIAQCPRETEDVSPVISDADGVWFMEVPDRDYVWIEVARENAWLGRAAFDPRVEGTDHHPYRLGVPGNHSMATIYIGEESVVSQPGTGWLMVDALDPNSLADINGAVITVSSETTPPWHNSASGDLQWGDTILDGWDVFFINLPAGPLELEVSFEDEPCRVPPPFLIAEETLTFVSAYCG